MIGTGNEVITNQMITVKYDQLNHEDIGIARKLYFERTFVNKMKSKLDQNLENIIQENYKVNFPLIPKLACA
jgi:hypothetical protein